MKVHLATEIGTIAYLRIYYPGACKEGSYHDARTFLGISGHKNDSFGEPKDYAQDRWPTHCKDCGVPVPESGIERHILTKRRYDTPSGLLEPGCMYWNDWLPKDMFWSNQQGPYLEVLLPNGNRWNIDSRASNCGLPDDKEHRCWCRHGDPPNITVNKVGRTCNAGAGSIWIGDYHGMLENGEFRQV